MANILCLETSSEICSIALGIDGHVSNLVESNESYSHASEILSLIDQCLAPKPIDRAGLDAIAFSMGPGSFTGLRVGAAAAKAICFALDLPLIGLSTLYTLANSIHQMTDHNVLYAPMIDARRDEVYLSLYDQDLNEIRKAKPFILSEEILLGIGSGEESIVLTGDGARKFEPSSTRFEHRSSIRNAGLLCPIAEKYYKSSRFIKLASFTPVYLKEPNITQPKRVL